MVLCRLLPYRGIDLFKIVIFAFMIKNRQRMDMKDIFKHKLMNWMTLLWGAGLIACGEAGDRITVEVDNESDVAVSGKMVELPLADLQQRFSGEKRSFRVLDAAGGEIPSQLTYDSLLIFQVSLTVGHSAQFTIQPTDQQPDYPPLVGGRVYPERDDDMAWENERVGFRAYGPALQRRGERGFGYDLFFKHPDKGLVLEQIYARATNPGNGAKVDSLRAIDPQLARAFMDSVSYHIDHGLGMDCFLVGPTLGAGVAAPLVGDTLAFPWCYEQAEVLDNGPLRFTFRLDFAPRTLGEQAEVVEHRLVSLDAGSQFNRTQVWYEHQTAPIALATGFPVRDDGATADEASPLNRIAYSHPPQWEGNGRALLGVAVPDCPAEIKRQCGHLLVVRTLLPGERQTYYWGFQWQQLEDKGLGTWVPEMDAEIQAIRRPLTIRINN